MPFFPMGAKRLAFMGVKISGQFLNMRSSSRIFSSLVIFYLPYSKFADDDTEEKMKKIRLIGGRVFSHFSRKFLAKMQKTCKNGRFLAKKT